MRVFLGGLIWVAILVLGFRWLADSPDQHHSPLQMVSQYTFMPRQTVEVTLTPACLMEPGDPVYAAGVEDTSPIGRVQAVTLIEGAKLASSARIELYSCFAEVTGTQDAERLKWHYQQTPSSMAWVATTMLPPKKRQEIVKLIADALANHQAEITAELQPLILKSLKQSAGVMREDLARAIEARKDRIEKLALRYQVEIVQKQLVPLFQKEIWPIIREEGEPVAREMGQQIWEEASLWRLSWRYLYDVSPLPQKNLTQKEFDRLITDKVTPMIVRWLPKIYETQKNVFKRISENKKVSETSGAILSQLGRDPELQGIILDVMRDAVTENPRLAVVFKEVWKTPEAKATLIDLNSRLEPTVTGIGEAMFGNPATQITPEFSTVLRKKVLFKDKRWITAGLPSNGEAGGLIATPGPADADNPFHVPARSRK